VHVAQGGVSVGPGAGVSIGRSDTMVDHNYLFNWPKAPWAR
jgi:hypothetical protein